MQHYLQGVHSSQLSGHPKLVHGLKACHTDYTEHTASVSHIRKEKPVPQNFWECARGLGEGILPCFCDLLLRSFVWPAPHDLLQTT